MNYTMPLKLKTKPTSSSMMLHGNVKERHKIVIKDQITQTPTSISNFLLPVLIIKVITEGTTTTNTKNRTARETNIDPSNRKTTGRNKVTSNTYYNWCPPTILQTPLEKYLRNLLGHKYYFKRLLTGMAYHSPAPDYPNIIKNVHVFRSYNLRKRNKVPFRLQCNRRVASRGPVLHFNSFHGSQKNWRSKTGYRSKNFKLICSLPTLQNGKSGSRQVTNKAKRLYDFYRSQSRLLSRSVSSSPKTILRFPACRR